MDPYQAWRRGLISYDTFMDKFEEANIDTDATDNPSIDPGDYDITIAQVMTIDGDLALTAPDGILVSDPNGSIVINTGGSLTILSGV